MSKLATLNGMGIVFQGVRDQVRPRLTAAQNAAKEKCGPFEAVIIGLPDGGCNLQLHMDPDNTFLCERISSSHPVRDFNKVVRRRFSN
jgi:hypothetical protein